MSETWEDAIRRAEETGDLSGLVRMLRSVAPMDDATQQRLAKLCEDYELEPIDPTERPTKP